MFPWFWCIFLVPVSSSWFLFPENLFTAYLVVAVFAASCGRSSSTEIWAVRRRIYGPYCCWMWMKSWNGTWKRLPSKIWYAMRHSLLLASRCTDLIFIQYKCTVQTCFIPKYPLDSAAQTNNLFFEWVKWSICNIDVNHSKSGTLRMLFLMRYSKHGNLPFSQKWNQIHFPNSA